MLDDLPESQFEFQVKNYIIKAIRNPTDWDIKQFNSMTTIGVLAGVNNLRSAVIYFYWPGEQIPEQSPPHPPEAPLTLELHYPISAYAAIIAMRQGSDDLQIYYRELNGRAISGLRQMKFISRDVR